ncbi:Bbp16 family capsid cement protein [Novosphingobium resinovorum]|uniref:Uncharacterized protein n=1 Tax=Novosphingobium resinovorum TaxID=158500 RepID=A0A1D8A539_9SPHN|nr:hypothetical protein [Novosphingobium resinovorum]AOR77221.1 hypothetical protein BES08_11010 [Novosphingobium resinovorum]
MALFDEAGLFSEDQAITVTARSTNIIDFGAPETPIGNVGPVVGDLGLSEIEILVQVTEAFVGLTSLAVAIQFDDDVAFGSPTTLITSQPVPVANLKVGYKFRVPAQIPEGALERYASLNYVVAGGPATAGKVFAGIVASRPGAV